MKYYNFCIVTRKKKEKKKGLIRDRVEIENAKMRVIK